MNKITPLSEYRKKSSLYKKKLLAKYIALQLSGKYVEYGDENFCGKVVFFYRPFAEPNKLMAGVRDHKYLHKNLEFITILTTKE